MVTRKPEVIVVKEIGAMIDRLVVMNVQVSKNMPRLSRDYLRWPSTVTSQVTTETAATELDTLSTNRHLTDPRILGHQAIAGTDSKLL